MGTKFFIYKDKQWLELDTVSGKLDGLRRKPQFLYVKNGTLQVANTSKLLRGLRELAAGMPKAVKCGLRLSQQRKKEHRIKRRRHSLIQPPHCCKCMVRDTTVTNEQNDRAQVQITSVSDAITQTSLQNTQAAVIEQPQVATPTDITVNPTIKVCRPKPKEIVPQSDSTKNSPLRELLIDIEDVDIIRKCLSKNPDFLNFDLNAFNKDENYRNVILYKLNPLVNIKKINLEGVLRKNGDDIDVKQFAAMLGLTHISDTVSEKYAYKTRRQVEQITNNYEERKKKRHIQISSSDEDFNTNRKVNNSSKSSDSISDSQSVKKLSEKNVGEIVHGSSSSSSNGLDSDFQTKIRNRKRKAKNLSDGAYQKKSQQQPTRKKIAIKKGFTNTSFRSTNGRDYSSLEDHAIVAWVGVGGRERKVNGNKIWRELQAEYKNITGLSRSWHSLRNRYLRYILPSLGKLFLEPAQQTKLRAGAARGELKLSRKRSFNKHNSLLASTPVVSAWSKRPRSPSKRPNSPEKRPNSPVKRPNSPRKRSNSPVRPPNSSIRRLNLLNSPDKRPNSLRKRPNSPPKEIDSPKRRLLSLRRRPVTPNNTDTPPQEGTKPARALRSSLIPSYSTLTKKFADAHPLQNSSSSGSEKMLPESLPEVKASKTRRLFNPKTFTNI